MQLSDEQKQRILQEEEAHLAEEQYREQVRLELQSRTGNTISVQANSDETYTGFNSISYSESASVSWFMAWRFFIFIEVPLLIAPLCLTVLGTVGGLLPFTLLTGGVVLALPLSIQKMVDKRYRSFNIAVIDHLNSGLTTKHLTYGERWKLLWSGLWRVWLFNLPLNVALYVIVHRPVRLDSPGHIIFTLLILPLIVHKWFGVKFKNFHLEVRRCQEATGQCGP